MKNYILQKKKIWTATILQEQNVCTVCISCSETSIGTIILWINEKYKEVIYFSPRYLNKSKNHAYMITIEFLPFDNIKKIEINKYNSI